jgi:hypothetical protein
VVNLGVALELFEQWEEEDRRAPLVARLASVEREMAELSERIWAGEINDDPSLGKRHGILWGERKELLGLLDPKKGGS